MVHLKFFDVFLWILISWQTSSDIRYVFTLNSWLKHHLWHKIFSMIIYLFWKADAFVSEFEFKFKFELDMFRLLLDTWFWFRRSKFELFVVDVAVVLEFEWGFLLVMVGVDEVLDSYVMILQRSSILVVARSNDSSSFGSWLSSSRTAPQPSTRAKSFPVPKGSTPIWHFKTKRGMICFALN